MSYIRDQQNYENLQDIFDEENKFVLRFLFENKHILQDDLTDQVSPLLQHSWEVMTRKLEIRGIKYSWIDLRNKFKYWVKTGIFNIEVFKKICESDKDFDNEESSDNCWNVLNSISTTDQNMPHTSTPKNSSKHMTNFVCNVTISPIDGNNRRKHLIFEKNSKEKADKLVQTSMNNVGDEFTSVPLIYYIDPQTNELKPVEGEEVLTLDVLDENNIQEPKKRKLEMSQYEKSIYEHQKKIFRQKMVQNEKEHEMKMKLLENQLKSGEEVHKLEIEIAKLKRDILAQKNKLDNSML